MNQLLQDSRNDVRGLEKQMATSLKNVRVTSFLPLDRDFNFKIDQYPQAILPRNPDSACNTLK